ncbi:acyltransferase [Enterobacter hormaechei subsp. steigerwaltii]|uniref:acyltransferase family protein n=1 Tax=Enterobacter cloacae complex TaxID=354276 RepID=UPI000931B5CB|nr:acyltransferase [Enterobacter hormaechei]MCW4757067.1 acyltransferase [Enterobacter hormaechei subsp. xiangfangensis]MCW4796715.1 acyltransferase [Enterobacter hormaechei subsp. xiangfangensis]MDF3644045.1 acyltransferase [Enterobacter hormaechei]OYE46461.1 acyltransferase [Enterobacter hormaechei subsp. steigerwaltii]QXZ01684.1 acyltransferase [Enterobacter hormaechei subsp. steigerwaltii]
MNKEIKALTGIRGIFAIYVMFYHINPMGWSSDFIRNGYLAVDLFFVLSGFIMCYVYKEKFISKVGENNYMKFLYNRFTRIYPLYFFAVSIVFIFFTSKADQVRSFYTYVCNIIFAQSVTGNGIIEPAWSLSTEVIAYLLFPFILSMSFKYKQIYTAVVYASLCALCFISVRSAKIDIFTGPLAIVRCLSEYVIGVLSFKIYEFIKMKRISTSFLTDALSITAIFILSFKGLDIVAVILFAFLIASLASSKSITSIFLSSSIIYYSGLLSYSIYIWHGVFSRNLSWQVRQLSEGAGISHLWMAIALTLISSVITYHLLEKPLHYFLKKLA